MTKRRDKAARLQRSVAKTAAKVVKSESLFTEAIEQKVQSIASDVGTLHQEQSNRIDALTLRVQELEQHVRVLAMKLNERLV